MTDTIVSDGQTVSGAILGNGDTQTVQSTHQDRLTGGQTRDTVVDGGGKQILNYGTAVHTVVNAHGEQDVQLGSVSNDAVLTGDLGNDPFHLFNDGLEIVYQGTADRTIVGSGGQQAVAGTSAHPGTANNTVIRDGGYQSVGQYGTANGTIIEAGGAQWAADYGAGPASVTNTVIESGATQILYGASESGDVLNVGGTIIIGNIDSSYIYNGTSVATTASFDQSTGTLTVSNTNYLGGTISQSINLAGDYTGLTFSVGPAPLTNATAVKLLCFCRGTRIATPCGDVAVERLTVGDVVSTAEGKARTIRWLGSAAAIVHDHNKPIVIRSGAFADTCPDGDLRVTAGHSFLFGNVLIPIGSLVNGSSIHWDDEARVIEMFHIELERHDVLLANGAPAESYRDDGNRTGFTSAAGVPGQARRMPSCAPVVASGPIVERTRRRLQERGHGAHSSPWRGGKEVVEPCWSGSRR